MRLRRRRAPRALALLCCAPLALPGARAAGGVAEAVGTAEVLAESGNHVAAIALLEEVVARAPADPAPYNQLAILLVRRGELERARDLLDRALRTDPAYADIYANLQAVLGALAARAYARALDDGDAPPAATLELAAVSPGARGSSARGSIPAVVTRVPTVPLPEIPPRPSAPPPVRVEPLAVLAPEPPAPLPALLPGPADTLEAERVVADQVRDWARAWSAQDVDAYLDHYSDRFRPGRGQSLDAWRAQRRARLTSPEFIEVALANLDVRVESAERASARFEQTYRSDRLRSTVAKTLELARDAGSGWRIVREKVR